MKLNVFVHGKLVAALESKDGFAHALTYIPDTAEEEFVSLLMPVQAASWDWPTLHPFFQISLPEGFLLSVLKETLGAHLGAQPLDLLAVVGRNTIGRVQVAAEDTVALPTSAVNLKQLLHGEHSEAVFVSLVREYAASGVSGVIPKFLTPETMSLFRKASFATDQYIVKGSSPKFPFVALNEHLCMEAVRRTGFAAPKTLVSDDGQTLVVERFDVDYETRKRLGFEDFCSLLGLAPEDKYQSTWERVARLANEWVASEHLRAAQEQLAATVLFTYALGNADCHTKNLAFNYSSSRDVRLAPIYDMVSILVYDGFGQNPPGMYINGRKTWMPGKSLWDFLQQRLGIEPPQVRHLVDNVCTAVASTVPEVIRHAKETPGFSEIGSRMLREWNTGMNRLSERSTVSLPNFERSAARSGLCRASAPARRRTERMGHSPLLARRGKRKHSTPS